MTDFKLVTERHGQSFVVFQVLYVFPTLETDGHEHKPNKNDSHNKAVLNTFYEFSRCQTLKSILETVKREYRNTTHMHTYIMYPVNKNKSLYPFCIREVLSSIKFKYMQSNIWRLQIISFTFV